MSRLTKHSKERIDRIDCNVKYCPEDCNTCEMYTDIRKKLAYYEDLEESINNKVREDMVLYFIKGTVLAIVILGAFLVGLYIGI